MKGQPCLRLTLITVLTLLGVMLFAVAGTCAELKIAKVNLAAVSEHSTRIKNAMEDIRKVQMEVGPKIAALAGDIKKIEEQLKTGGASLSKEEKEKLENELNTKKQEIQQEQQGAKVKMSFKQQSISNVIKTQLQEVLQKEAKEGGYSVILNSDSVLYSDGVTDLTEKVTKALDAMPATEVAPK